jgi:hypothetical protein
MLKLGLWLLPWFPLLITTGIGYGHFHPEFFMDDGPWPYLHPIASHFVLPVIGLPSLTAFLVGLILALIAILRRLFAGPHSSV